MSWSEIHDWIASSPFTKPVPAHLDASIRSALEASNQEISNQCGGLLAGWDDLQGPSLAPSPVKPLDSNDSACWEVMPPRDWFEVSLGRRAAVGRELLEVAQQNVSSPSINISTVPCPERPDLWESPFTVGFLSVGFRRFRSSMPGVSEFLEKYRPDVLFLGDLGTGRNKIGRLKLHFEEGVNEEWFLWTNIQKGSGYPVGSGAAIHASAAKHISQWDIV